MKRNNNINECQQELNELAPTLAKLPKRNPFLVPENYFEEQEQELTAIHFEKKNPFEVPDNYFNELQNAISKKVQEQQPDKKPAKIRTLYIKYSAAAAIAAMLIFTIVLFYNNDEIPNQSISGTDVNQYLMANIDVVEYDILLDLFTEDELKRLSIEENDINLDLIDDSEMEDFIKYNIDINLIEGELL